MLWLGDPGEPIVHVHLGAATAVFALGYIALVAVTGLWGRWLARRVAASNFQRNLKWFNRVMEAARILIGVWFAAGLFLLNWRQAVAFFLPQNLELTVIGFIVGTFPPLAAWAGLWWSEYPADRALREQNQHAQLEDDLPVHPPQPFANYLASHFRHQILFIFIPLLLIVVGHDLGMVFASLLRLDDKATSIIDAASWIVSTLGVFLFSSEVLRRVLRTESLAATPLRRRLDALSRRTGIAYRDVLLWKTDYSLGNAAVMGLLPQLRYILLSDLLLERMPDEEIEAVFAHEMGHIVHRHMIWYVLFVVLLGLINIGSGQWIAGLMGPQAAAVAVAAFLILKFLLLFGFVSRTFERQADVFAARTIQMRQDRSTMNDASDLAVSASPDDAASDQPTAADQTGDASTTAVAAIAEAPAVRMQAAEASSKGSYVGPYGATLFGSALRRIAVVNNIPLATRSWCHGSIATRMRYLQGLSQDPSRTSRFDRFMRWMYAGIVGALVVSGTLLIFVMR